MLTKKLVIITAESDRHVCSTDLLGVANHEHVEAARRTSRAAIVAQKTTTETTDGVNDPLLSRDAFVIRGRKELGVSLF